MLFGPPYFSNAFFSELVHLFFLIFCMKLEIHKCTKVTEPDFLENSYLPGFGQKGSEIGFFDFCSKLSFLIYKNKYYTVYYFLKKETAKYNCWKFVLLIFNYVYMYCKLRNVCISIIKLIKSVLYSYLLFLFACVQIPI